MTRDTEPDASRSTSLGDAETLPLDTRRSDAAPRLIAAGTPATGYDAAPAEPRDLEAQLSLDDTLPLAAGASAPPPANTDDAPPLATLAPARLPAATDDTLPPGAGATTSRNPQTLPPVATGAHARNLETLPAGASADDARNPQTLPPDGRAETLAPGDTDARPSSLDAALARWDRYEILGLLGRGGMGTVYRARDRRLDRPVAIKFILGVDPNLTLRFLREARAQARIDHPGICGVYEVGDLDGRAYLALQFVDGEPLHKAAEQMSLDQKIGVMRDVAAAVQEAHALGIIHRDLKPGNIMVERADDGRWRPIVMDFGLARETTVEVGLTESGAVLGTPAYMSPEQAQGNVHLIDRRSDVYSLGATLYELLTGRPVFVETSLALALAQVIHDEPTAPRTLVPSLPADLETISLKCLTKDPAQRYPSARALADDLARYLAGEPILGRRQSRWQRLRLRARRHRALVALGASSLVIIAIVGALGIRAAVASHAERERAAERTVLAQRLGRDTKDAEFFLRAAYLAPLHDTRPERKRIRDRMTEIAHTQHDLGALGDAIVHDALGRGHLALHDWREAAEELGKAADAGLATPELHAARGRALGELYQRELEAARRTDDKAWLARKQRELEQQYLAPGLAELERGRASSDGAELVDAQIALYHHDFTAAEKLATSAADAAPWLFEARKLAADAAYGAGMAAFDKGDYDAARPALERAVSLYDKASEFARSDASVYEAGAQAGVQLAELNGRQNRSPREVIERALAVIERALDAAPDNASGYITKGDLYLHWYRSPTLNGILGPRELLDRVSTANARAAELAPLNARAWDGLGNSYFFRGLYEQFHGGEGTPWWKRSLEQFDKALRIDPNDPWINNDIGVAHRWLGQTIAEAGGDPMPEYRLALRACKRSTEIDHQYLYGWSNQIDLWGAIADYTYSLKDDPRPAIDNALQAGKIALHIDPNYNQTTDGLIRAYQLLAQYLTDTGASPSNALTSANNHIDNAEKVKTRDMSTWYYRAVSAGIAARTSLRDHLDPTDMTKIARASLNEALRLAPDSNYCHINLARIDLLDIAWRDRAGKDSGVLLDHAQSEVNKAIAIDPRYADAEFAAAQVSLQLAKHHRTADATELARKHIERALELNPYLHQAQSLRDELRQLLTR